MRISTGRVRSTGLREATHYASITANNPDNPD